MNVFAPRLFWARFIFTLSIMVKQIDGQNCGSGCISGWCNINYCQVCKTGYFQYDGLCIPCGSNCEQCSLYDQCINCFSGYYRPGVQSSCSLCSICVVGQATIRPCGNNLNAICETCASNQIAVNVGGGAQVCQDCPAGTYRTPDKLSCATCTQCTSLQYVLPTNDCTSTQNRVCTDCPDNKATKNINSGLCDTCRPGYYLQSGLCYSCASLPCPVDRYQDCSNAVRNCYVCTGMTDATKCSVGYGPNPSTCPAGTTQNPVCEQCPAGSERPNLVPYKCSKCNDGFYKTQPGTANCQPCTNAPASNSFYIPWGNTLATTASCEWYVCECVVGFHGLCMT